MDQPQAPGAPQAPSGGDAPSSITREDVAEIVNKAIGARNKLFEKQVGDSMQVALKDIREGLSSLREQGIQSGGGKGKKGKDGEEGADESPALKSLQRQVADLKADNERIAQTAAAEKAKGRDQTLRQRLSEALGEFGIKEPARIKHAIHHLVDGEKRIGYSEDGESIVFRDQDESVLDLATGLKSWAKSTDGQYFIPPTGARGSGDGRGGSAPAKPGTIDKDAVFGELAKLFG